ncbi:MAG: hypothetical protein J6M18_00455 [Actinomycetaceae bacterium]|nr:hypothetical protein [Actinomycetaceae bacterium]
MDAAFCYDKSIYVSRYCTYLCFWAQTFEKASLIQANRNKAANRAKTYVGRAYNLKGFAFNKTANGKMNCSQLVWAAYKTATGIDLDGDGGHGVYPRDIKKSK